MVGHELRAGGAIQTQIEQIDVFQCSGQRFHALPSEHCPHRLDRAGDGNRDSFAAPCKGVLDSDQCRLHVPGVLGSLHQQIIHTALDQTQGLGLEVADQFLEGDSAGHGDGLGRGPHRAGDPYLSAGRGEAFPRFSGQLGRAKVDLVRLGGQPVLSQDQGRCAEGVGPSE